jgi:hypothetical protein
MSEVALPNIGPALTSIFVQTRFIAFHCWPDAPAEVSFLRDPHRHEFHVRLDLRVSHADRDAEFFIVRRELDKFLDGWRDEPLGSLSCEMIAGLIIEYFQSIHYTVHKCAVSEDGENGAEVVRY